jgi:hypothetical protein
MTKLLCLKTFNIGDFLAQQYLYRIKRKLAYGFALFISVYSINLRIFALVEDEQDSNIYS